MNRLQENPKISHYAFSDEASYNIGRFRAIGMISLPVLSLDKVNNNVQMILRETNIKEFKWHKLKSAKWYNCAIKLIDYFLEAVLQGKSRLDVLIWDIEDSRHKIKRRDDCANLARMYYQLYKNVLIRRWPSNSTWQLFPDENSSIDWETVKNCLSYKEIKITEEKDLFRDFALSIKREFNINYLEEVNSSTTPIIGLADLFAGMGVYSRLNFDKYQKWEYVNSKQRFIFPKNMNAKLSIADKLRCPVIKYLYNNCKKNRLGVSLKKQRGLWTAHPKHPINFWHYKPQSSVDRAPVKNS